jgi:signal transduction histidine kinase
MNMDDKDLYRMNSVLRHRLRNFASGIKTAVTLLSQEAQKVMSPQSLEYFPLIVNECNSIQSLTQRLNLFFDQVHLGGDESVGEIIQKTLIDIHNEFPESKLQISDSPGSIESVISGGDSIRIALVEIIRNAIESDKSQTIQLDCYVDNDFVHIRVIDKGSGLPEDNPGKIFLPFYTTRSKHVGLGLSIARRMAEKAGGNIKAGINEGSGLTVDIGIPLNNKKYTQRYDN